MPEKQKGKLFVLSRNSLIEGAVSPGSARPCLSKQAEGMVNTALQDVGHTVGTENWRVSPPWPWYNNKQCYLDGK